jgi:Gene product 88
MDVLSATAFDPSALSVKELEGIVGTLSNPSKMPAFGYSIPAKECITGGKLRKVKGSTCSGCYAMKGRYVFPNVENAMYRRMDSLSDARWVPAIAELIRRKSDAKGIPFFRWHDSGDLQSVEHLEQIVAVCQLTPHLSHWLPTREYRIVADFRAKHGEDSIPSNLVIRMSAHMVGGKVPSFPAPLTISTVSIVEGTYPEAHDCPSRFQGNSCGDCRACWNPNVPHVDYHAH